jgi:hypothetical protein
MFKIIYFVKIYFIIAFSASFTLADNKALLDQLKNCAAELIAQKQKLINANKDGSPKGFSAKAFAKESYKQFKKMIIKEKWKIKDLKGSNNPQLLASALAYYIAAARIVVAKKQKLINTDKNGSINPKNFYPAVFGRLTADLFQKKTGIQIKQTTMGKGMGARNSKYNSPDAWEKEALNKLESKNWNRKKAYMKRVIEEGKNYYRYIFPLEMKKACLSCHGDPRGSKDISGYIREGYKLNDIRGGISIKIPL